MLHVFKNKEEASKAAADLFVQTAQEAIARQGRFTVALSGGSSPDTLYQLLASPAYSSKVDWPRTFVFWSDERWVPLTDKRSNARMTSEILLDQVPIPPANIYPMWNKQQKPEAFAADFELWLRKYFGNRPPAFDLMLLGMGDDGHTASLFPGTEVLNEQTRWVQAYYLAPQQMYRVTLTAPLINKARRIVVLAFGGKKAPALYNVLEGPYNPATYPAQLLKPVQGELIWLVDEAATIMLDEARQ